MSELPPSTPEPPASDPAAGEPPAGKAGAGPNTVRTWVISGIVAAVVAVAVVVGLHFATSGSKTKTAAAVATSNQPGSGQRVGGNLTTGTIATVDGSKLTLTETDGTTVTVATDAKTRVSDRTTGSLSDLTVGSTVRVLGTTSGNGLAARSITVGDDGTAGGPGGPGGGGGRFRRRDGNTGTTGGGNANADNPTGGRMVSGQVTAVNGTTITITETPGTRRGSTSTTSTTAAETTSTTVTVTTSSDTTVTVVKSLSVSDLHKGDKVAVLGTTSANTITATAIIEGDTGNGFGFRGGRGAPGGNGTQGPGGNGANGPGAGGGMPGGDGAPSGSGPGSAPPGS